MNFLSSRHSSAKSRVKNSAPRITHSPFHTTATSKKWHGARAIHSPGGRNIVRSLCVQATSKDEKMWWKFRLKKKRVIRAHTQVHTRYTEKYALVREMRWVGSFDFLRPLRTRPAATVLWWLTSSSSKVEGNLAAPPPKGTHCSRTHIQHPRHSSSSYNQQSERAYSTWKDRIREKEDGRGLAEESYH